MRAGQEVSTSAGGARKTRPLTEQNAHRPIWSGRRITTTLLDEADDEDRMSGFGIEEAARHVTWQKVVETPSRPTAVHPPRPPLPPQSHAILRNMPYRRSHVPPVVLFWSSLIVLFFFVAGGVFGIMGTLGRGRTPSIMGATLQITPSDVSVGATMNLRGSGFSPRAQIGFTRDAAIPVVDTNGSTIITSRADGSFTDTIIVGPDWISGTHTISAEDATTHKFTSSPIQVTGMGDLLRPAHLELSTTSLDLGVGDQALDSVQKIALTNLGGGQISWQANATQPWLTISPKSGTFYSGMKTEVEIAGDRSHLPPGSFNDQVLFASSAGDSVLPIKMSVTALPLQQAAVLQISPAVLSFASNDGGSAPDAQVVTIGNPGQLPLHWTARTNAPWLSLSSQSGSVDAFASGQARVSVDTNNLLPGTYNGTITFNGDGVVMDNLRSISVSVTIMPGCALTVASDMLSFTAGYLQSAPAAKSINLSATNCSSSMAWKATSHASWLTISQANGSTPASPAIGINVTGLNPGTYTSSVTFSSSGGTQEVPVRFIMSQLAEPVLSVGSTRGLNFYSGQGDTTTQNVTLTNTGSGTLLWSANAITGSGGSWLSVSPASGSISANQSAVLAVTSTNHADMVPGTYSGTVNVAATDQQGRAIAGSPQYIPVSKVVNAACKVAASPTALTFSAVVGQAAPANQSIILTAGSGCANVLNWSASVASDNSGKWLTATTPAGSVSASNQGSVGVGVALNSLATGSYHGTVTITTVDSVTHATIGNPRVVSVVLNVTAPSPSVEVSATAVSFSTTAGTNPASQTITIVNTGSGSVSWQTGKASQPWLSVSPRSGSSVVGSSSTLTLSADVAGLTIGTHEATVMLKPSSGPALVVKASLRINEAAPTPAVTPDPTPLPTAAPQPSPVPTTTPIPAPTAAPSPNPPTPTQVSRGAPPPVQTVAPSPLPHPTAVPTPRPTAIPSPVPTTIPTAIPQPTRITKKNYTPPVHVAPSPIMPPKAAPTEVPVVKSTPEPQSIATQKPVMEPTPEPGDVPPPTSIYNKGT